MTDLENWSSMIEILDVIAEDCLAEQKKLGVVRPKDRETIRTMVQNILNFVKDEDPNCPIYTHGYHMHTVSFLTL